MTRRENLTGKRFGRVVVERFYDLNESKNAYWECRCDCGVEFIAWASNLKSGKTKSCGCLRRESMRNRNLRMGAKTIEELPWWEREKLLTEKDRTAIREAKDADWMDIDENAAETEAGRYELHCIATRKYHNEEYFAGIL